MTRLKFIQHLLLYLRESERHPYKCSVATCDRTAVRMDYIRLHVETVHKLEWSDELVVLAGCSWRIQFSNSSKTVAPIARTRTSSSTWSMKQCASQRGLHANLSKKLRRSWCRNRHPSSTRAHRPTVGSGRAIEVAPPTAKIPEPLICSLFRMTKMRKLKSTRNCSQEHLGQRNCIVGMPVSNPRQSHRRQR